jgi:hypothetical protein
MKRVSTTAVCAVLTFAATTAASASAIVEVEFNNSIAGAQFIHASAFTLPVPGTVFGPPDFPAVGFPTATISGLGGGGDVDFYAFTANGGDVYFDIDNGQGIFDTILSLFDSSGTLIALGDDSEPEDPGSLLFLDSFLGVFSLPGPGTYYLAVSQFPNYPTAFDFNLPLTPLTRPDGVIDVASPFRNNAVAGAASGDSSYSNPSAGNDTAPYTLHVSVQNPTDQTVPVPEPATLLLFGAGLSATAARMRRRR